MSAVLHWFNAAAASIVLTFWVKLVWVVAWLGIATVASATWRSAGGRRGAGGRDGRRRSRESQDPDIAAAWRLAAVNIALVGANSLVGVTTAFAASRTPASGGSNAAIGIGSAVGLVLLGGILWTWGRGFAYYLRGLHASGRSEGSGRVLVWLWVMPPVAGMLWFLVVLLVARVGVRLAF